MHSLPCLLIGFARVPGLINSLQQGVEAGIRKFYVSIDGPTSEFIAKEQIKIIEELRHSAEISDLEVFVQILDENLGSGVAVISAINWFFENEESGIILEDDLEVDGDFFKYIFQTLEYYKDNSNVLSVSGFNPFQEQSNLCVNMKVRYPISWGWATTRTKWKIQNDLLFSQIPKISRLRPVLNSYWYTGKSRALTGKIDAWDIPLAASMRFTNYVTILPPVNLVTNTGSDNFASHTSVMEWPLGVQREKLPKAWKQEEISQLTDVTDLFESRIYRISVKNIFSKPGSKLFDYFRFKNYREPMKEKVLHHSSRKMFLGGREK